MNVTYTMGKQMVIMDPRLCYSDGPVGTGANVRPLAPPFCYNSWVVNPTEDTLEHILDHASKVAHGVGKLDAIHFIGHGAPGYMWMGLDDISMKNVHHWSELEEKVKVIVLYGCQTGADIKPGVSDADGKITSLGKAVAVLTKAKVIACKEGQKFYDSSTPTIGFQPGASPGSRLIQTGRGGGALTFVNFNGDVYICSANAEPFVIPRTDPQNRYSPSTLNLGSYIFSQN